MPEKLGYSDINQFRTANRYDQTQNLLEKLGLVAEVVNSTPTVGVNIAHLATMESVRQLEPELRNRDLNVAILGLSSFKGPEDFARLLKALGGKKITTTVIDLSDGIFQKVRETDLDEVVCLQEDARQTGLENNSQDLVLRDHLDNCCPPIISRQINAEVGRILKPGGLSIVNLTTSELLLRSTGRQVLTEANLSSQTVPPQMIGRLNFDIYDLVELQELLNSHNSPVSAEIFRAKIIEIGTQSFTVFGSDLTGETDPQGHGEWFRSLEDHQNTWLAEGLVIEGIKQHAGFDSHNPPLFCLRHNIVLRKED